MALDDELNTKANQFGTEAGGRIFNKLSTDFAPQPFAEGGGNLKGLQERQASIYKGMAPYGTPPDNPPRAPAIPEFSGPRPWNFTSGTQGYPGENLGAEYIDQAGPMASPIEKTGVPEQSRTVGGSPGGGFSRFGPGISGNWAEPETAATRAGDVTARSRIMSEARESGERGMEAARGQSVLDKEASARAKKEGEFDYDKFKESIGALGGKLSPKLQSQLYQHALTEHGRMQDLKEKAREANLIHGEGSASMISAKSEAKHKELQDQFSLDMHPHLVQKNIEEIAKIRAETGEIPYKQAHMEAQSDYWKKMANAPEMRADKGELDDLIKLHDSAFGNPQQQKIYQKRIDEFIDKRRGESKVSEFERQHPQYRGRVRWNSTQSKVEEIK